MRLLSKKSRIDIQKRIDLLSVFYGQKNLSKKLNKSESTIKRYKTGKTKPDNLLYAKINKLYNKNKNFFETDIFKTSYEAKKEKIKKQTESRKRGTIKERQALIYPDYMYTSPAERFSIVNKFEMLEELSVSGYLASWRGTKEIPLEVQFILNGENLKRFGKIIKVVGVITRNVSPKLDNDYTGQDTSVETFSIFYKLIKGLNKQSTYEERIEKIRDFFFEKMKISNGYALALLGFYFEEGDEL